MALAPENLDEKEIYALATEVAKLYMSGKGMGSSIDFLDTFFDVREAAAQRYMEREMKKKQARENLSIDDIMNDISDLRPIDEELPSVRHF